MPIQYILLHYFTKGNLILLKSEVIQSCPTLCNPMGWSLPGSSVHGILQARVLEWVAISFSRGSSWPRDRTQVSCIVSRRYTIWATSINKFFPISLASRMVMWPVWPIGGKHMSHCRQWGQCSLRKVTERAVDIHLPFSAACSEVLTPGEAGASLGPWDRQRFLRTVGQRDRRSQGWNK